MAKSHKKKKAPQPAAASGQPSRPGPRPPKSLVLRLHASAVGAPVSQLTADFRRLMSPDTAARLRERRANKLKDYLAMAGPLGVTHLFMFSRSKNGNIHFRVALTPRGPTLTFRVEKYSLSKDVGKSQKRYKGGDLGVWARAPLVVMNNFAQTPKTDNTTEQESSPEDRDTIAVQKQLESLMTTVFQGIFPPITPSNTQLSSIKRILLLNRESPPTKPKSNPSPDQQQGKFTITLRHYAITTRPASTSKRIRRLDPTNTHHHRSNTTSSTTTKTSSGTSTLPNLSRLQDAADYLLSPSHPTSGDGYTTASDTELDTDNEVEVLSTQTHQKVLSKKQRQRLANSRNTTDADGDDNPSPSSQQPSTAEKGHIEKRAVKLLELGPRMKLRLVKVEEGICAGRVMWNEFVSKSKEEENELEGRWKVRREEREERRRKQRENVERKRKERGGGKTKDGAGPNGGEGGDGDGDGDENEDMEGLYGSDFSVEDFEDVDAEGGEGWEDDVEGDEFVDAEDNAQNT